MASAQTSSKKVKEYRDEPASSSSSSPDTSSSPASSSPNSSDDEYEAKVAAQANKSKYIKKMKKQVGRSSSPRDNYKIILGITLKSYR